MSGNLKASQDRRDRRLRRGSGKLSETEAEMQAWVKCRRRAQRRVAKR
ncbi:MAG TPA: hypothetical protein VKX17_01225 [Planctomycetota bacterium]|nr:hypothetical protein [Planctomycetota bacterium]